MEKRKITSAEFISIFLTGFIIAFLLGMGAASLPLALLGGASKIVTALAILMMTFIISFIVMEFVSFKYNVEELPAFEVTAKTAGVVVIIPLILIGIFLIVAKPAVEKIVIFIFSDIVWSFVASLPVYTIIKSRGSNL